MKIYLKENQLLSLVRLQRLNGEYEEIYVFELQHHVFEEHLQHLLFLDEEPWDLVPHE